jgi:hypothetical protein
MTLSSAWGHDGETYDGKEMRQLVETLTGGLTGVASRDAMAVLQQTSPANTVKVAAGGIVIAATGSGLFGSYQIANDAELTSPTFTGTGASARTDRLIVRVTTGVPALEIVAGTPGGGTPPPPTVTGDNFEVLARIEIPASTSNITTAMIKDERKVIGPALSHFPSTSLPAFGTAGQLNYAADVGRLYLWNGSAWQPTVARARARRTSDFTAPTGGPTNITWQAPAAGHDPFAMWSAGNPTRLTAPWTGIYSSSCSVEWSSSSSGAYRRLSLYISGTFEDGVSDQLNSAADANPLRQNLSVTGLALTAGQFIEVRYTQDTGSDRTITTNSNMKLCYHGPG